MNPNVISFNIATPLPVTSGGTGLSTIPANGQLLIGNSTGYTLNPLTPGSGITIGNGAGTISVTNSGVLSILAGSGISASTPAGNVTVTNTGVLSFAGGSTGLTPAAATVGAVSLAGTLVAGYGGTGLNTYAVGDIIYASGATALSRLADVATGNALISGGVTTAPSWGKIGLTTHVSGTLPIANGGTNATAVATAGAVAYGTGTAYSFTAAGTVGQVLTSAGAGTPTWATAATGTVTSVTGTAPVVSSGGTTPAISMPAATTSVNGYLTSTDWNTFNGKGSGTVTNVSFTGGIVSVATATTTPALTVAGTTGGVPYFSSASTWATSGTLGANFLVFGGGAGVAPSTPLGLGTGVQVLHGNAGGNAVWGSVSLTADVSGTLPVANGGTGVTASTGTTNVVLSNGPTLVAPLLGTPASGVLTNCTGTATGLTAGNATTAVNTNGGYVTLGASNTLTLGSSSYVIAGSTYGFFINSSGDLANLYKFDNSGAVRWYNYGAGAITSDASGNLTSVSGEEYKIKDGVPKDPVRMLMNLKPEYYFWADTKRFNKQRQLGFFAQNVNKAIGEEAAPTPVENIWINEKGVESRNTPPWGYYDRSVLSVTVLALQKLITEFDAYKAAHP